MPWITANVHGRLPRNAIVGGRDSKGNAIYVGRAMVNKNQVPCSIVSARRTAYSTVNGELVTMEQYEVLCGDVYKWERAAGGKAPGGAVIAGRTWCGEEIFIGRVSHEGALLLGMILPSKQCILVPVGDAELHFSEYDVIVLRRHEGVPKCSCMIS